jgi:hypothetical protein
MVTLTIIFCIPIALYIADEIIDTFKIKHLKTKIIMDKNIKIAKEIISSILEVDSRIVELKNILPEDYRTPDTAYSHGNGYEKTVDVRIYAYSPLHGLRSLSLPSNGEDVQNADGSWNTTEFASFDDIVKQLTETDSFLVSYVHDYGWQKGSESWDELSVVVYPVPDKNEYLNRIEQEEIERWKKWVTAVFTD